MCRFIGLLSLAIVFAAPAGLTFATGAPTVFHTSGSADAASTQDRAARWRSSAAAATGVIAIPIPINAAVLRILPINGQVLMCCRRAGCHPENARKRQRRRGGRPLLPYGVFEDAAARTFPLILLRNARNIIFERRENSPIFEGAGDAAGKNAKVIGNLQLAAHQGCNEPADNIGRLP